MASERFLRVSTLESLDNAASSSRRPRPSGKEGLVWAPPWATGGQQAVTPGFTKLSVTFCFNQQALGGVSCGALSTATWHKPGSRRLNSLQRLQQESSVWCWTILSEPADMKSTSDWKLQADEGTGAFAPVAAAAAAAARCCKAWGPDAGAEAASLAAEAEAEAEAGGGRIGRLFSSVSSFARDSSTPRTFSRHCCTSDSSLMGGI
mmetsp:Transcript_45759/g.99413  ORF Transcript_45759/g.99413 Transcript_45759/m.99413 type:complete len:206 (+) Transcript_45759:280-897(+)